VTLGTIGGTSAPVSLTIASAANVTFTGTVRLLGDLTQTAGTGTTTLNGTAAAGISGSLSLTTSNVQFATAPLTVVGNVNIAAGTIGLGSNTGVTSPGTISFTAGAGGFTQAASAPVTTTSTAASALNITVNSGGSAALGKLTADSSTLTITANGGGAMTDNNDAATVVVNLSAKNITLVSTGAIGVGNPIEYMSPNTPTAPANAGIVNASTLGGSGTALARIDFGGNSNFTTTGFTHVPTNTIYTTSGLGYGFAVNPAVSQSLQATGYSVSTINLYRDGVTGKGTAQATFRYNIANGTYAARFYVGHVGMATRTRIEVEGGALSGQSVILSANVFTTVTISNIVVNDGVLDMLFRTPAGYVGSWLVCGFDLAASEASLPPTAPQRLEGLTFDEHGLEETSTARLFSASRAGQVLTPETVEQARREAIADWITTGLTPGQILALQNATVQITDLNSEGAFGFAGSRLIQLDDDALGFGWHVGSGPVPTGAVDLGTVLRHELGHILGYGDLDPAAAGDDIMSGTILPGERRGVASNVAETIVGTRPVLAEAAVVRRQNRPDLFASNGPADSAEFAKTTLVRRSSQADPAAMPTSVTVAKSASTSGTKLMALPGADIKEVPVDVSELQSLDELFSDPLAAF
jgi:hypothetical protein